MKAPEARELLSKVFSQKLVQEQLRYAAHNITGGLMENFGKPDPLVLKALVGFVESIVGKMWVHPVKNIDLSDPKWKAKLADEIHVLLDYSALQEVLISRVAEVLQVQNPGVAARLLDGGGRRELSQLALAASVVTSMIEHGLDPELARLSDTESRVNPQALAGLVAQVFPDRLIIMDETNAALNRVLERVDPSRFNGEEQ